MIRAGKEAPDISGVPASRTNITVSTLPPVLGIITGTGAEAWIPKDAISVDLTTPWGVPSDSLYSFTMARKPIILLNRHGADHAIPPHRVNHRANLTAMKQAGCTRVIGVGSCGSLRKGSLVPSLMVPDDYICFNDITIFEERAKHILPGFDHSLRARIMEAAKDLALDISNGGTYIQSKGPRLETRAEIRIYSGWGDVIGMTVASEATVARELELEYAAILSVDNMAYGLSNEDPNYQEIKASAMRNASRISGILERIVEEM